MLNIESVVKMLKHGKTINTFNDANLQVSVIKLQYKLCSYGLLSHAFLLGLPSQVSFGYQIIK